MNLGSFTRPLYDGNRARRGSLGNPVGTSPQVLTQDTLDVFMEGSFHVLLGVFKAATTNDDYRPLTNPTPAILFGPETAIER